MAWVGLILGTLAGLSSSIFSILFMDLPLWAALMLHPVIGSAVTVFILLLFLLRNDPEADGDALGGPGPVAG